MFLQVEDDGHIATCSNGRAGDNYCTNPGVAGGCKGTTGATSARRDAHIWPHTYMASTDSSQPLESIRRYSRVLSRTTSRLMGRKPSYAMPYSLLLNLIGPAFANNDFPADTHFVCYRVPQTRSRWKARVQRHECKIYVASCQEPNAGSMFQVPICATTRTRRMLVYVRNIRGPLLLRAQPENEGEPAGRPIFSLSFCCLTSCGDAYPYSMFLWPLTGR